MKRLTFLVFALAIVFSSAPQAQAGRSYKVLKCNQDETDVACVNRAMKKNRTVNMIYFTGDVARNKTGKAALLWNSPTRSDLSMERTLGDKIYHTYSMTYPLVPASGGPAHLVTFYVTVEKRVRVAGKNVELVGRRINQALVTLIGTSEAE